MGSLIVAFSTELKSYAKHIFMANWQRSQFNNLKDNLPDNTALLVLDFAENYTCHYQNQVQAAYYDLHQVTIHPVVIYTKCKCDIDNHVLTHYRIYVSDDRNRDAAFVKYVLEDSMKSVKKDKYKVFSDNCGQQYKSRLPFHHMRQLSLIIMPLSVVFLVKGMGKMNVILSVGLLNLF